jgi:hypothetical protein
MPSTIAGFNRRPKNYRWQHSFPAGGLGSGIFQTLKKGHFHPPMKWPFCVGQGSSEMSLTIPLGTIQKEQDDLWDSACSRSPPCCC